MYGLTRATTTLIAAGVAGLLIWIATQISDSSNGGFWAVYGLIAGAGLIMALSQLLGGWTKWGMPRLSAGVFLLAFVPVAIAGLWIVIAAQPNYIATLQQDRANPAPALPLEQYAVAKLQLQQAHTIATGAKGNEWKKAPAPQ